MGKIAGTDISRYQTISDWDTFAQVVSFVVERATVGDYYTDAAFDDHWIHGKNVGIPSSAYHVVAPADSTLTRRIPAKDQMDLFFRAMDGKKEDFKIVLDCELPRSQPKEWITEVIVDCIALAKDHFGVSPIIYTRKTWWDYYVYPHASFAECDLWAARYSSTLTSPWSDGWYTFRDWTDWWFWQWSSYGTIPGASSPIDLDWFNGDENDFRVYMGGKSLEQRIAILEREALARGWNLEL